MNRMNSISGAEAVVRMAQLHGVTHILGQCGDTNLPWHDALYRLCGDMCHVLSRDERFAFLHPAV